MSIKQVHDSLTQRFFVPFFSHPCFFFFFLSYLILVPTSFVESFPSLFPNLRSFLSFINSLVLSFTFSISVSLSLSQLQSFFLFFLSTLSLSSYCVFLPIFLLSFLFFLLWSSPFSLFSLYFFFLWGEIHSSSFFFSFIPIFFTFLSLPPLSLFLLSICLSPRLIFLSFSNFLSFFCLSV